MIVSQREFPSRSNHQKQLKRQVNLLLIFFIAGLVLSGVTAFPIKTQLDIAHQIIQQRHLENEFSSWIERAYQGVSDTDSKYPFIAYGTDWLAFAHLVIAVAFIGPLRDPVRNIWVVQFGIIACMSVFPLALIAGEVRHIPWFWRIIDCSFGAAGGLLLWICYRKINRLSAL